MCLLGSKHFVTIVWTHPTQNLCQKIIKFQKSQYRFLELLEISECLQRPIAEYWKRHDFVGVYSVSKGYKAALQRSIRCWDHSGPSGQTITSENRLENSIFFDVGTLRVVSSVPNPLCRFLDLFWVGRVGLE